MMTNLHHDLKICDRTNVAPPNKLHLSIFKAPLIQHLSVCPTFKLTLASLAIVFQNQICLSEEKTLESDLILLYMTLKCEIVFVNIYCIPDGQSLLRSKFKYCLQICRGRQTHFIGSIKLLAGVARGFSVEKAAQRDISTMWGERGDQDQ